MTPEPSPERSAPQVDVDWAFGPRRPVGDRLRDAETFPLQVVAIPVQPLPSAREPARETDPKPDRPTPQSPRRRYGRILLALAVLAASGTTAAYALHRQEAAPTASKHLAPVWQVPAPAKDDELIGSWLTDKQLIRASIRGGVTAYDLADGSVAWSAALPPKAAKAGSHPCAMSPTLTADGRGTIAFGEDGNTCTTLAGIDASIGKILWSVPLVDSAHKTAMSARTYLQGNVATVVSENFLGGLDIRTGHRVWGFEPRGNYCNAYDWGADGIVVVDDYCADQKNRFTLTAYDGRTGKVLWSESRDTHTELAHVFSGSPLIASEHRAGNDSVRVFAPSGRSRKLAVGDTEITPGNGGAADHSARLVDNVLIAPAQTAKGSEIDAFDTRTGAKLWTYHATALVTATAGDDRIHAIAGPAGAPQLMELDPRTGRATPTATLPVSGHQHFTTGTVYVTPGGGVLELDALGTSGGIRFFR
ncbi:PQQ-binding-like beta-propeller repeat protein [Streptomyces sp. NPDC050738]|uniref:outer membrane protein assembly factor BamB family protein n=1 Tax=Streptomyces sp. NPDC050738 TaxID=3154744 RepID=UPI003412246A